uniref:Core-binding (CB) domain-containing protein n=1 Tax=Candidatus Methanomethylicus mesodigestus TaxID=1867258 RepID=A0A7C3F9V8_9CREN
MDLKLSEKTVFRNRSIQRRVLQECEPDPSTNQLREFLGKIEDNSTRDNYIKGLRTYFTDYKNDLVSGPSDWQTG